MQLDRDTCYRAMLTRDARFDGRFFTCVHTTGIYCRPICPARAPKLEHVRFLPTAAAAQEAGFRPCLRCRPETSPDLAAWHGTSSTVSRGMALIAGGALNEDGVEALASRLGVGERQLRRLFRQHIGAAPSSVAHTNRVLFAKRLITDTTLPLTEVALAAGFGSVRRFNDTFLKLYGRPPRALRRDRRDAAPPVPGSAIRLVLPYKPPYDWEAIRGFLAARAIPGIERVAENEYARTIAIDGKPGSIAVSPGSGRTEAHSLVATIRCPSIAALPRIVDRIRCLFDLGADPAPIGALLARHPELALRVARHPGLRVAGAWDGFELAVRAILGQQISVAAASRLAGKLVAAYGTPLAAEEGGGLGLRYLFPAPSLLARAELATTLGMPRARADAITGLAAAAAADPELFARNRGLDEAARHLASLPGIGAWTAQVIAMRALREPDAFPASDIGLLRALPLSGRRRLPAELLAVAEAWRPWRAYAAMHLWTHEAAPAAPEPETHDELLARPPAVADRDHSARL